MRISVVALGCVFSLGGMLRAQDAPLRVAEATAKQCALEKAVPEYPPMAKQLRLTGKVEVEALIDLEGRVAKAQVVKGNPLLGVAAVAAMKKWKFTPFVAGGKSMPALTTITFDFRL